MFEGFAVSTDTEEYVRRHIRFSPAENRLQYAPPVLPRLRAYRWWFAATLLWIPIAFSRVGDLVAEWVDAGRWDLAIRLFPPLAMMAVWVPRFVDALSPFRFSLTAQSDGWLIGSHRAGPGELQRVEIRPTRSWFRPSLLAVRFVFQFRSRDVVVEVDRFQSREIATAVAARIALFARVPVVSSGVTPARA